MNILAPSRAEATILATDTPAVQAISDTPARRDTRPCDGRVAAIRARMPKAHKAFNKASATFELSPKGASLWDARGEALASKHERRTAPTHIRRVSRAQETSDRAVAWAIPGQRQSLTQRPGMARCSLPGRAAVQARRPPH